MESKDKPRNDVLSDGLFKLSRIKTDYAQFGNKYQNKVSKQSTTCVLKKIKKNFWFENFVEKKSKRNPLRMMC